MIATNKCNKVDGTNHVNDVAAQLTSLCHYYEICHRYGVTYVMLNDTKFS